jgi:hypothetical protein
VGRRLLGRPRPLPALRACLLQPDGRGRLALLHERCCRLRPPPPAPLRQPPELHGAALRSRGRLRAPSRRDRRRADQCRSRPPPDARQARALPPHAQGVASPAPPSASSRPASSSTSTSARNSSASSPATAAAATKTSENDQGDAANQISTCLTSPRNAVSRLTRERTSERGAWCVGSSAGTRAWLGPAVRSPARARRVSR